VSTHSPQDLERGRARFAEVMSYPAPTSATPFVQDGVVGSVFGDLWTRGGLTTKERRLISITCVCTASVPDAVDQHLRAALVSGDITIEELEEFVLHFAYYAGWPRASLVHATLTRLTAELRPAD
jgi:4-carboxymuconolactone decarboxylase